MAAAAHEAALAAGQVAAAALEAAQIAAALQAAAAAQGAAQEAVAQEVAAQEAVAQGAAPSEEAAVAQRLTGGLIDHAWLFDACVESGVFTLYDASEEFTL